MFAKPVPPTPTRYRVLGAAAAIGAAAALFAGTGAPAAAGAAPAESLPTQYHTPCSIDPAYLPQSADAATSWLVTCFAVDRLPRTADAIVHWR